MNALSEYIERMIGPFLFVTGMALFLALYQHEIRYVQDVQEVYVSDDVYAQHYDKKQYTDRVTRDEIMASLVNGVTSDVIINWAQCPYYAGPGNYSKVKIVNMAGDRFQIEVYKRELASEDKLVDVRVITSLQGYRLNERTLDAIIPKEFTYTDSDTGVTESWSYAPSYSYDNNGNVKSVGYHLKKY